MKTNTERKSVIQRTEAAEAKILQWADAHEQKGVKTAGSRLMYIYIIGSWHIIISYGAHVCYIELKWHGQEQLKERYSYKKYSFVEFQGIDIDAEIKEMGYEEPEEIL